MEVIHPRCCGIDIHKESVVACLRLQEGRRAKTEVRQFGTTTAELLRLHEWLAQAACTWRWSRRVCIGDPSLTCSKAASTWSWPMPTTSRRCQVGRPT